MHEKVHETESVVFFPIVLFYCLKDSRTMYVYVPSFLMDMVKRYLLN